MDTLSRQSSQKFKTRLYVCIMATIMVIGLAAIWLATRPPHKTQSVTVIIHTPTQSIEYKDVVIQRDQDTYVTFLTKDGQQIEHTGAFSVIRKEASK